TLPCPQRKWPTPGPSATSSGASWSRTWQPYWPACPPSFGIWPSGSWLGRLPTSLGRLACPALRCTVPLKNCGESSNGPACGITCEPTTVRRRTGYSSYCRSTRARFLEHCMAPSVYRYRFGPEVPIGEVEHTLLICLLAVQSLHGEA